MSYIGRGISNLSDRTVLDSITASATATYNLLLNTVAYVPSSAESLTVSLNGVIQAPQSSYTVSGSTIVFASSLASTDSIDFILAERAITLTTIGSGTVTTSNIVDGNVTNAKLANSSITLNGSAVSLGGSATIGGGKIGQLVTMTHSTSVTTTSASFQDSGATLNITPSATSSKVFVIAQVECGVTRSNAESYMSLGIMRATTQIFTQAQQGFGGYIGNSNAYQNFGIQTLAYVDSPSSTSQLTYKINFKASQGNAIVQYSSTPTILTLMEVLV